MLTIAKDVDVEVALAKIEAAAPPGEDLALSGAGGKEDKAAAEAKGRKEPRRPRRK